MTEGTPDNPLPADDFELHARKWTADERILREARAIEEQLGLHPDLLDAVEEAIRADDQGAVRIAFARFLEAAVEARDN